MREIALSKDFKKDVQRDKISGKYKNEDFETLKAIISDLHLNNPIDLQYKRHSLKGDLKGYECIHVKNDWLLVFKGDNESLKLVMLGKHTQVYKKFK